MTKIFLVDNSVYELKDNEEVNFGIAGIYVRKINEKGDREELPIKFYGFGFVNKIDFEEKRQ